MTRRGWTAVAILGALIAALAGIWAFALGDDDAPAAVQDDPDAFERWAYGGEDPAPARAPTPSPEEAPAPNDEGSRTPSDARRAVWQERWRQAVRIAPLGDRAPTLTADAIREALSPSRERLRECVGESGGWRSLFEARRAQREATAAESDETPTAAPEEGRRRRGPRSRVSFDVRPDGTVNPASLRFDPPMPEAFAPCFEEHFLSLRVEGAGDGASVELPMGPPGGRRSRGASDGGVGRGERGRRGGATGPRGGERRRRE